MRDHYQMLRLPQSVDQQTLNDRILTLAAQHRTDQTGHDADSDSETFAQLEQAWDDLHTQEARAAYDQSLERYRAIIAPTITTTPPRLGLPAPAALAVIAIVAVASILYAIHHNPAATIAEQKAAQRTAQSQRMMGVSRAAIRSHLRNPDSVQWIRQTPPQRLLDGQWQTAITYRAQNGFGGYSTATTHITLTEDGAITAMTTSRR